MYPKFQVKNMVRKEILNFVSYIPGKPIQEVKREYKIKNKIIKLASNENNIGVSLKVINKLKKNLKDIYLYPDSNCYYLRKKLAEKFSVQENEIIVGSGSDELIELIAKTFFNKTDEIIVSEHAFIRYKMAGDLMGTKVISTEMNNFTHNLDAMFDKITKKTKAIFIANPNNPTGTYNTEQELNDFLDKILKLKLDYLPLIIIDEAYYEYAKQINNYPDTIRLRKKYQNLVILRTFSKIYSLAGLRIGWGISNSEIIEFMDRIRPPFNVNSLAQIAAIECLNDRQHIQKSIRIVEEGKKYLYNEFKKLGIEYIKSAANFILVRTTPYKGKYIFIKLLEKGVIVRAMDEYNFPDFIRVSIGKPKENKKFISEFKKIYRKGDLKNDFNT